MADPRKTARRARDPGDRARLACRRAAASRSSCRHALRRSPRRRASAGGAPVLAGRLERPVVIALPRGGVPVGVEVAAALGAPLEILAVRKLGAPGNPELAVGAVAEDGTGRVRPALGRTARHDARDVRRHAAARVARAAPPRGALPARARPRRSLQGQAVIVVDDGLATGLTVLAAVRAVRQAGARRSSSGVPVGAASSIAMLAEEADEVVCVTIPARLLGVGMWYQRLRAGVRRGGARAATGGHRIGSAKRHDGAQTVAPAEYGAGPVTHSSASGFVSKQTFWLHLRGREVEPVDVGVPSNEA